MAPPPWLVMVPRLRAVSMGDEGPGIRGEAFRRHPYRCIARPADYSVRVLCIRADHRRRVGAAVMIVENRSGETDRRTSDTPARSRVACRTRFADHVAQTRAAT